MTLHCMSVTSRCSVTPVTSNRWLALCHRMTLHLMFSGQMPHMDDKKGLRRLVFVLMLCRYMLKPLLYVVTRKKGRKKRFWVKGGTLSYLTVTSSVNLRTRCVRMLRGMVLPLSCLWGGLLFRHAGRVELYTRAPPMRGWG